MTKRKNLSYYLGNGLIMGGLILLLTIYLPIIRLFLPIPVAVQDMNNADSIYIQKINAYSPIIKDVDPWNELEYKKALRNGVAQARNIPNFYFAHSSDSPWNMTSYNISFLRLGELGIGDEILIKDGGVDKKYRVVDKKVVWPSDVKAVTEGNQGRIILQTCTPIGTSLKRLLVFAEPAS